MSDIEERELARLRTENDRLREDLAEIRGSESYRVGHVIVEGLKRPIASLRGLWSSSTDTDDPTDAGAPRGARGTPGVGRQRRRRKRIPSALLAAANQQAMRCVDVSLVDDDGLGDVLAEVDRWRHEADVALVLLVSPEQMRHPLIAKLDLPVEEVSGDEALAATVARLGADRVVSIRAGQDLANALAVHAAPVRIVESRPGMPTMPSGPFFIGGTGRSGTWVMGRLLTSHPHIVTVHTELRFHASNGGFARLLSGELTPDEWADQVVERWYDISGAKGTAKGVQLIAGKAELRRALARFRRDAQSDVPEAARRLMHALVDPYARGRDAATWAETTPDNAAAAGALTTIFPSCRVIHMTRDGRDTAASVVSMPWGPETFEEGLEWWARRVRDANLGLAAAAPDRVLTVRLEELVKTRREETLERLLDFLGLEDTTPLRHYFDGQMDADRGNVGRWRGEVSHRQRDRIDRRYRELYSELAQAGHTELPIDPDTADELALSTASGE